MAYKVCSECNNDRLQSFYKYDDSLCDACYSVQRIQLFESEGIEWDKVCDKCDNTSNAVTNHRLTINNTFRNTCNDCVRAYSKSYYKKNNFAINQKRKREYVPYKPTKILSKANQKEFTERFNRTLGVKKSKLSL